MTTGATRQDRTGDLLITKYSRRLQTLHSLYTEVPVINNLGKLLSAQIATPDTTNRWGFDPVLAQQKQGPGPINSTLEMPGPNHRPLSVPINRSLNAAADRSIASSAFFIGAI